MRDYLTNHTDLQSTICIKMAETFPPNFLHESWMDYLYWDIELETLINIFQKSLLLFLDEVLITLFENII